MMSVLTLVTGKEDRTLRRVRISDIARNPNQPRKYFDPEAIAQLAESIRQYGVLNPLTVRRGPNGGYELVAGERRLRAARVAGLNDVPCLVISADSRDSSAIALVENLQRRDLDFFEEASGFKRLIEQYGLTQEEAARKVGKTQSAVANKLRLLRLSPQNVELIRSASLTERHARSLLRLEKEEDRINATHYIIEHDLNVSRTEQYIDHLLTEETEVPAGSEKKIVRLIKDVRFFLNTVNRAIGVMVDSGVGATVDQQETDDGLTLTINIPNARS
ncbi:ParB/RepB/Spo0J family partition protein [Agathobaculum sp. NTUH-O15-33]|uniref:ParB/RepB/Spo0J family partition protein n=1 Tax=Agathobaculum sp. NTUH-O15-33 TaxID=3079302 RepID=UPI002958800C|nr:ParB/RepB/Spo0J family partition protein [Agathobaculum sp. NTUH-O15-33]WNX84681.1 ParB/RepB/Spo0J family partition protein [Agathobaculum sp. NTUH-O15-33]